MLVVKVPALGASGTRSSHSSPKHEALSERCDVSPFERNTYRESISLPRHELQKPENPNPMPQTLRKTCVLRSVWENCNGEQHLLEKVSTHPTTAISSPGLCERRNPKTPPNLKVKSAPPPRGPSALLGPGWTVPTARTGLPSGICSSPRWRLLICF